jgi:hypothetical protein
MVILKAEKSLIGTRIKTPIAAMDHFIGDRIKTIIRDDVMYFTSYQAMQTGIIGNDPQ